MENLFKKGMEQIIQIISIGSRHLVLQPHSELVTGFLALKLVHRKQQVGAQIKTGLLADQMGGIPAATQSVHTHDQAIQVVAKMGSLGGLQQGGMDHIRHLQNS